MSRPWVLPALGAALLVAGCGSESYANRDRPAAPVTVTAAVDGSRVRLSPSSVGAGPVTFIVANLTDRAQRLMFETAGRGPGIRSSASVGANDTTQLQVSPKRGSYQLSVRGGTVEPATLHVGAPRSSAQGELQQP
jgi:hypothetical protein